MKSYFRWTDDGVCDVYDRYTDHQDIFIYSLHVKDEVSACEPTACINCGRCVDACPSRIIPSRLADFAERHDEEAFLKFNGLECVECGSCSYVCPAKRQLKQSNRIDEKNRTCQQKEKIE
ncbi:MAG: 4Fe-4S dicluster domain-containing protein [Coprococcus sp.]